MVWKPVHERLMTDYTIGKFFNMLIQGQVVNAILEHACTILACQVSVPTIRNNDEKLNHVDFMIREISQRLEHRPVDLVVLPELCTIEYGREAFQRLAELSENFDGPSIERMSLLAAKYCTTVVFGMPRCSEGRYFISQVVIGPDGELVTCYDKLHICQYGASMEKEFFQPGQKLGIFSTAGFRFAPVICYDIRLPELSRTLALEHEVDCILHCGAYYRDESFFSWHPFAITRAMENQLYLLSLNRAGANYGNSIFCFPWMDEKQYSVSFKSHGEDFRYLEIVRSRINQAREQYTFLKDRLSEYKNLPY